MGRLRSQDVLGGLLAVLVGGAALVSAFGLTPGSLESMGPGFLPRVYSAGILVCGAMLLVRGLRRSGKAIEPARILPLLLIAAALISFALMIERLGLFLAVLVAASLSCFAEGDPRPVRTIILIAALGAGSVLLFITALGLPIRAWPVSF